MSRKPESDYSNRIVVFIDILGMKEYSSVKSNEKKLRSFYKLLERITNADGFVSRRYNTDLISLNFGKSKDLDYKMSLLGDAIVITFHPKYLLLLNFLTRIIGLVFLLSILELKLSCRGAITIGKIYHSSEPQIIYGRGLGRAATIEGETTLPRIVIDDELVNKMKSDLAKPTKLKELMKEGIINTKGVSCHKEFLSCSLEQYIIRESDQHGDRHIVNIFDEIDYKLKSINNYSKAKYSKSLVLEIIEENIGKYKELGESSIVEKWKYIKTSLKV